MDIGTVSRIWKMYNEDYLTLAEIAADFGCSVQYISFEMRKLGYSFPHLPQKGYKDPRCRKKELFEATLKECATFSEAREKLNLSQSAVRGWMRYHGLKRDIFMAYRGAKSKTWKGGYFKDHKGYVWVNCEEVEYFNFNPDWKNRAVMVHKVVAEWVILGGIILYKPYIVHHIDQDRSNNVADNLAILNLAQHKSIHSALSRLVISNKVGDQTYSQEKEEIDNKSRRWAEENIKKIHEVQYCTEFIREDDLR